MSLQGHGLTRQQLRLILGGRACSQIAIRCEREVSSSSLERALEEIVGRHEALRTELVEHEELEQPRQIVRPQQSIFIRSVPVAGVEDLERLVADLSATERDAASERVSPGIRVVMLLLGDLVAAFIVTAHAAHADAASMLNIAEEIDRILSQRPESAPSTQYLQYAEWQAGLLETIEALDGKAFWKGELEALRACDATTTLPGRETSPKAHGRHRETSFRIGRDLLERLARRAEVGLEDVLVGLWAICLWRASNRTSVAFAVAHHARCFPELESSVGAFAQYLPFAVTLEPALGASAYLRKLHERLMLLDEQHPFVETLGTNRDPVVVDPRIAFEFVDLAELRLTNSKIPPAWLCVAAAGEELKLSCTASEKDIHVRIQYDPGCYSDAFCARMLDRLRTIASDLARVPDAALVNIDATPPEVRAAVARAARATTEPKFQSLVDHVDRHGALRPDTLALVDEGRQLSYAGLVRRISGLAEKLRAAGAGRESVVAIILESSIDLVPSMLAAWRIGAAFSVIDVQWPEDRLAEVLETLRPAVVICRAGQKGVAGRTIVDCRDATSGALPSAVTPPQALHPHQLAYVVFTSATSGPPKGVMVEHRQIYDYSVAISERLGFQGLDHFLAVTTLSADLAYTMVFPSLLVGGCLHIASRVRAIDAEWLSEYIERWGIDFIKTVPSHLLALLAHPHGRSLMPRKYLVLGGEAVPPALLTRIRDARFINHYGPAETAVGVFAEDPETRHHGSAVPLGRELPHVYTYLQVAGRQIAPPEVAGELIIGGHSVTRGYLGRPGATAEKFRPDEHSDRAGARVYETGDLVRRSSDDEAHFVGRKDGQLKIRGYRVETREVAEVLTSHPAIHHAHVCPSPADPQQGSERASLIAYAVVDPMFLESVRPAQYQKWSENWRKVFESAYAEPTGEDGSLAGNSWKSSYTGEPMSDRDVHEQVDAICEKVLSWKPRTILEIGCGTGMLLENLAPHCERYVGTDFSATILNDTRRVVARAGLVDRVELIECEAHELDALGAAKFDVILLNSVIQYFADVEYFEHVMRLLERRLTDGGKIFLGDVRDRRLLESLHASVTHFRAAPGQPVAKWASRVRQRIELDSELCFEPQYFLGLADRLEHIRHADITLKRGFGQNELVRFRFDVTLFNRPAAELPAPLVRHEWDGQLRLDGERPVLFRSIPNARLLGPVLLAAQLANGDASGEVKDLSLALEELEPGVEPEELWKTAHESGYEIRMRASLDRLDRFDAFVVKRGANAFGPHRADELDELYRRVPTTDSVSSPLLKQLAQSLGAELKDLLKSRLPEYMVPSAVVLVTHLPVTLNGKLDSSRLPFVSHSRLASDQEYVETKDAIERTIARVWEEILGIDRVGAEDDFFALGGHSLLATEVVAKLQAIFQVQIPLTSFFGASPTVRGVAKVIIDNETQPGQSSKIAELWEQVYAMSEDEVDAKLDQTPARAVTAEVSDRAELPLSDAQQRVLREYPDDAANPAYNNSVLLRLKGPLKVERLRAALCSVVARHEAWRTVFRSNQGVWSQRVLESVDITLMTRDVPGPVESSEARLLRQAEADEAERFDIGAGPLIRAVLYRLDAENHALLVVAHHLVCDGWTVRLAVAEIAKAYAGHGSADVAVGYRELLNRQLEWLRGAEAAEQKRYWIRALEGFRLPELGRGLDVEPRSNAARESKVSLPKEVVDRLHVLARRQGVSPFGLYLSALYVSLVNETRELDITIGTPMHNRLNPRDKQVFGCCVNLQPIRMSFGSVDASVETIEQVWGVCRLAQQNQSLCVFSHVFADETAKLNVVFELLDGELEREIELDGLDVSVVPMPRSRTRHDVHVVVRTGTSPALSVLYRESMCDGERMSSFARTYEKTLREFSLLGDAV